MDNLLNEWITEIERLRAENKELLSALEAAKQRLIFLDSGDAKHFSTSNLAWIQMAEETIARCKK